MLPTDGVAVIVGGSIAGVTAAEELRMAGHQGPVVLIDEQAHRPYARPPLSKAILTGKDALGSAFLPPFDDFNVECRTDAAAVDLLPHESVLVLSNGERLSYDGLVIATGASPFTMADLGLNATGLPELVLRTLDDAALLSERFKNSESVIVVGGGILGMELASAARHAGLMTTVLTNEPPLLTMGGRFLSKLVSERAERAGVEVQYDAAGVELVERDGRLAASLAGHVFRADMVVTAVGDRPRVEWLLSSGLADKRGVQVDDRCRVTASIVAAGDVTTWGERRRRTPHWAAAIDQARVAAQALIAGDDASPYRPRPYYWSDQFGLALKIAGECPFPGEPVLIDGDEQLDRAVYQWSSDQGPVGALTVNSPMPLARLHRMAGSRPRVIEPVRS